MSRTKKNWDALVDDRGNYYKEGIGGGGGGGAEVGPQPPTGPGLGDLWIDINTDIIYYWDGLNWVPINGTGAAKGEKGIKGNKGDEGEKGTDGEDLLEILTKGGILPPGSGPGDLADLLKGDKGVKGEKGDKGDKGVKGDKLKFGDLTQDQIKLLKGEKGQKGEVGEKGDGLIETFEKGGIINPGEGAKGVADVLKGDKGDTGSQGDKGNAGFGITIIGENPSGQDPNGSVTCDTNGNALIDVDTGGLWICDGNGNWTLTPPITGPKGEKGDKGEDGEGLQDLLFKGGLINKGDGAAEIANLLKGEKGDKGDDGEGLAEILEKGGIINKGDGAQEIAKALKGDKGDKGDEGEGLIEVFEKGGIINKGEGAQEIAKALKGDKGDKGEIGEDGEGLGIILEKGGIVSKGDDAQEIADALKGDKGDPGPLDEPDPNDVLHGRVTDSKGAGSYWKRSVDWLGDTMVGKLKAPELETGPNNAGESILFMDTGANSYNGGPHELEAREGAATDLDAWIAYPAAEQNGWNSVAYGNGIFVAVAENGTNRVMTSVDGEAWTPVRASASNTWKSVTYGNGIFVAVSSSGTNRVMTSVDGETWTARAETERNSWRSVTYGNGVFVAVAANGTNRVMTSPDGITWTARSAAEQSSWRYVTYGNGVFVALAWDGNNRVMTSPDGVTWTARVAAELRDWQSVTYGNGKFVAVCTDGANRVMTSPDGENWTAYPAAESNSWQSVTYGNGLFVAVARGGSGANYVMTSPDGETWTAHPAAEKNSWYGVTYGNGRFVAVSYDGPNRVMVVEALSTPGGLYFDNELLYTSEHVEPIREKVNALANAVVNNAESIEVIAPTVFRGMWEYVGGTSPGAGNYTIDPDDGLFANTTKVILDPVDSRGVDHTGDADPDNPTGFANVTEGNYFTILNTENPYGLSGRVTATEYDVNGNFVVTLSEVRAVDNPDGDPSSVGPAVIKVQKLIDPSSIDNINNILDGLNGNFNNIADQRGVVWVNDDVSLPAYLPSGNSIPEGKLYFNSRYLQLYIRIGGSWLGLL